MFTLTLLGRADCLGKQMGWNSGSFGVLALACSFALASPAPVSARSRTFSVLYNFCAKRNCADGDAASGRPVLDGSGNLIGPINAGGVRRNGAVYQVTPGGSETLLYSFGGRGDGLTPVGDLIRLKSGEVIGTTFQGGKQNCGTVFSVKPDGSETVLYSFKHDGTDGCQPVTGVIESGGVLYGSTSQGGGSANCFNGCGTVFRLSAKSGETVLHSFSGGADGAVPLDLAIGSAGNLYGATANGGNQGGTCNQYGCGTVFKLAPDGSKTTLYTFCSQANCIDGYGPGGGLILDSSGNLFGAASGGGANNRGVVFTLAPNGTETVLYNFCSQANCNDGAGPHGRLLVTSKGNIYGTTAGGGPGSWGTVFELNPSNGAERILHGFDGSDGTNELTGVLKDKHGNLFGVATEGGSHNGGTVFELTK
jgi:uncharacterized repeat protein (TIGR03803 family)